MSNFKTIDMFAMFEEMTGVKETEETTVNDTSKSTEEVKAETTTESNTEVATQDSVDNNTEGREETNAETTTDTDNKSKSKTKAKSSKKKTKNEEIEEKCRKYKKIHLKVYADIIHTFEDQEEIKNLKLEDVRKQYVLPVHMEFGDKSNWFLTELPNDKTVGYLMPISPFYAKG